MTTELLAQLRPALHRYCARMTGSLVDGEDVVQDTLERALATLGTPAAPTTPDELRRWLFRVAHNRAIDLARGAAVRASDPLDDELPASEPLADDALAAAAAVRAAIARFLELPPVPRSCVIMKDVLGHSLDEIAGYTELSLAAVKAALHRGRARLAALGTEAEREPAAGVPSPVLEAYAARFNARDWDGVRALLAEDVRLDLASRLRRSGRREVGVYFTNYATKYADPACHMRVAWLDGREVLASLRGERVESIVVLEPRGGEVAAIRDFIHIDYIAREARLVLA